MRRVEIREIAPSSMDDINTMCVMPGSEPDESSAVLKESAGAHRQAAAMGARVFGAFLEGGEPVGRIEIMPIEAAPVPLEGDGLWVIRCIWVLDKAKGLGIAGSLMRLALDAAEGSRGVAVLTYPGWMPPAFFERFGFERVEPETSRATALLRKADPCDNCRVSLVSPAARFGQPRGADLPRHTVLVEAVFGLRCPWVIQQYRRYLSIAGSISHRVITREHVIRTHADALRLGEENLYIDGVAPFGGPIRREELEHAIRSRLAEKGIAIAESEAYAPLIVNGDGAQSSSIPLQRMKSIAGQRSEVISAVAALMYSGLRTARFRMSGGNHLDRPVVNGSHVSRSAKALIMMILYLVTRRV